jgi:class 3 adenylate cyclase
VTLLFSDIEGSTRLLERLGTERYAEVLVRHRRLLRDVFETARAEALYTEAAELAAGIGDKRHVCFAHAGLAEVAFREQRREAAAAHSRESLRVALELGMKASKLLGIVRFAALAAVTGDAVRAARLAAAAEASGTPTPREQDVTTEEHRAAIEAAKECFEPTAWERAWAEGRAMGLDEAAGCALSTTP